MCNGEMVEALRWSRMFSGSKNYSIIYTLPHRAPKVLYGNYNMYKNSTSDSDLNLNQLI